MAYIEMKNIEKYYGEKYVLQNISLSVEEGEFATLLGSSGCGKTTLLRCFAGLETIDSGEMYLDGEDITHKSARQRHVSMIFQQYSLFPTMTVYKNVEFGLKMKQTPENEIESRVSEALAMVELSEHRNKYPCQLSGGEQQRVALARAIVTRPKVLLLDEPLSAIDAKLRRELQERIKEIHKELHMTSIFVTHNQMEALYMSDVIHLFNKGKIEQSGSPIEMYSHPKSVFAASFIGMYNRPTIAEFEEITGEKLNAGADKTIVAMRPETFYINDKPMEKDDEHYYMQGVVTSSVTQGNVMRYKVKIGEHEFTVDKIFNTDFFFKDGTPVYLSVEKDTILVL